MTNVPGMSTLHTYTPTEILGNGPAEQFLRRNCTIEEGQNLAKGTLIGLIPTVPTKFGAYDNDAVATATAMVAAAANTGAPTFSAVAVQDDYTLTEDWTLTCVNTGGTGVGLYSLTGSVSGIVNAGTVPIGSEFKYPDTSAYMVKFTITDGSPDATSGDIITFSTTRAECLKAEGILAQECDATDSDRLATYYTRGNFVVANLVGYDVSALADMNGRVCQAILQI